MSPAEELRAAAAKLWETCKSAFHERPWENTEDVLWVGGPTWGYRITKEGTLTEGDAAWITLTQPALAEPLAAWLETYATWAEQTTYSDHTGPFHQTCGSGLPDECGCFDRALAVARAITGRPQ